MLKKLLAIHRYPFYVEKLLGCYIYTMLLRITGVQIGNGTRLYGLPIVGLHSDSEIIIGIDCELCSHSESTYLGVNHPVILRTLRNGAAIVIGNNTGISGGVICAAVRVEIGNECLIGANVTISDTDFHPMKAHGRRYSKEMDEIAAAPVIIEDNVFIGTGAIILKGVRIGRNSVIGAGAVVTKDIPGNSIAAGNPAKLIKSIAADI